MSQKIRIKLKSYDYNLVDKSADKILKTVKSTGAVITGPIPLPTHKKIFTVLGFFHARLTQHRLKIFILREKFLHEFLSPTLPSNHAP